MNARYVLGCLSVAFLLASMVRTIRDRTVGPAARTWLIIGVIFGAVSLWF
jgi:hypothetical protein